MKILCVAEKPSIAKEVARILSGGRVQLRNSRNKYIKNYDFQFNFEQWGLCDVTMTSVLGHLMNLEYPPVYQWGKCVPGRLLDAQIIEVITKKEVYENIAQEARTSDKLMIWTDCDREGEFIGFSIFKAAQLGNPNITLMNTVRSQFSHLERSHVIRACHNPGRLDINAVNAVSCRMEVDFRVGTSFTRLLTDGLRLLQIIGKGEVASYGTCQFPTLGFIVDRYKRVKSFIPEKFWYINLEIIRDDKKTPFTWVKGRYFDRLYVFLIYQKCLQHERGIITKVELKPTSKYKPLPLTTVELQKDCSKYFKMSAKRALDAAEKLYNRGILSYPRTETDSLPDSMDFNQILQKLSPENSWGPYVKKLLDNGFEKPRKGSHDDKAHPAIHPVNYVSLSSITAPDEKKVYEYVVRRFLACLSKDAVGQKSTVTLQWGDEYFTASGLMVTQRNFLDIFTYMKWESSTPLANFTEMESIDITSSKLQDGKTSPPKHMTESELIALMDANGIGTDATIAEHIEKILLRGYIAKHKQSGTEYIVPSPLGMGLIDGFDKMEFDNISLSKPFLRKELEKSLQDIATGNKTKQQILQEVILIYKQAYGISSQNINILANSCRLIMQQN